jgi:hypothetical protein
MAGRIMPTPAGEVLQGIMDHYKTDSLPEMSKQTGVPISTLRRWKNKPETMLKPRRLDIVDFVECEAGDPLGARRLGRDKVRRFFRWTPCPSLKHLSRNI